MLNRVHANFFARERPWAVIHASERGELPPSPDFVFVGARFRKGRLQNGMSQRHVAQLAGVSQSVVSRFERGLVRRASAERIMRLAFALGPNFPFGFCPHDHVCPWSRDAHREENFWDILNG